MRHGLSTLCMPQRLILLWLGFCLSSYLSLLVGKSSSYASVLQRASGLC